MSPATTRTSHLREREPLFEHFFFQELGEQFWDIFAEILSVPLFRSEKVHHDNDNFIYHDGLRSEVSGFSSSKKKISNDL